LNAFLPYHSISQILTFFIFHPHCTLYQSFHTLFNTASFFFISYWSDYHDHFECLQDYSWDGKLVVTQYVVGNHGEVVAENVGQDESGCRIVQFLVVNKCWLDRSKDLILGADERTVFKVLDKEWYLP
jgi:hypothetical protein